jgi:uncharacterized protein
MYRDPIPTTFSQEYWQAAAAGRLLIQQCGRCEHRQFYPRQHCTSCLAADPDWLEASGHGKLHSFTMIHKTANAGFNDEVPYALALVDLDEGVRITCNVVDSDLSELACDLPVRVVMKNYGTFALPCVTLSEDQ